MHTISKLMAAVAITSIAALANREAQAGTIVVTSPNQSGSGSLAAAIAQANSDSSKDTILFDPGVTSIGLAGTLLITHPVILNGDLGNGSKVAITGYGFDIGPTAGGSTLTNLSISTNSTNGIGVLVESSGNFITNSVIFGNYKGVDDKGGRNTYSGNFIGTDITGTAPGNSFGLFLEGTGYDTIDSNVISGNHTNFAGTATIQDPNDNQFGLWGGGIWISSPSASHNTITNNHIGTSADGTQVFENGGGIVSYAGNNLISHNQLAGFHMVNPNGPPGFNRGIVMLPGADSNMISGNLFDGYRDLSGHYHQLLSSGDDIDIKSAYNTMQNNILLSNRAGIIVAGFNGNTAQHDNVMQNNLVNVDPDGNTYGGISYGLQFNSCGTGGKILNNIVYSAPEGSPFWVIWGGSIVAFSCTGAIIQGNTTFGGEHGINPLFGSDSLVSGNTILNTVGMDDADSNDVVENNVFSGNALSIHEHGANNTYSNNTFSNPLFSSNITYSNFTTGSLDVGYSLPFFNHEPVGNVLIIAGARATLANNTFTGDGVDPNMGAAIVLTGNSHVHLANNTFNNYIATLEMNNFENVHANNASVVNTTITGLGQTFPPGPLSRAFVIDTGSIGNILSVTNTTMTEMSQGFIGDSSWNSITFTNDLFSNDYYGVFDTSLTTHNIVFKNDTFTNNTFNRNY